jgi:hypothetical protein
MNRNTTSTQPDADPRKRREIRESKPVREWTAAERREVFLEARRIEQERADSGIVEDWELCEDCHENNCEGSLCLCKRCIDEIRQYEERFGAVRSPGLLNSSQKQPVPERVGYP